MSAFWHEWRNRPLTGGARWWRTTGALLLGLAGVQLLTGLTLMTVYTPSTTDAWPSVWYIQHRVDYGAVVRALHYYAAHAMIIVLAVHLVRVLVSGRFRPPYHWAWITGLLLAPVVLMLAASGNLLPWGQKELGQAQVETHIVGSMPVLGPMLQRLIVGGTELGQRALSTFFMVHVALLPLVGLVLGMVHLGQISHADRREATAAGADAQSVAASYFPYQSAWNAVAFAMLMGGLLYLAVTRPVPLGPPAHPGLPNSPRPEWYFLALFELRRYFTGPMEFVATGVIPVAILGWLILLPALHRVMGAVVARVLAVVTAAVLVAGGGLLTWLPLQRDAADAEHQAVLTELERVARRAATLAEFGVPPAGPAELLERDPVIMGPILYRQHCAACHPYGGQWAKEPKAADLKGFGTEEWIWGLVQKPDDPRFLGHTKHREMAEWSQETLAEATEDEREEIRQAVRWLAGHPTGVPEEEDESPFALGYEAFDAWCIECHTYEGEGGFNVKGPDFTGYGSAQWIEEFIRNPAAEKFYGDEAEMPAFAGKLTDVQIKVLARWLAGQTDPVLQE